MPLMVKGERVVLFVHIPKTGGSTVERVFVEAGWRMSMRETRKTRPTVFPTRRVSPQHYQTALLQEMFDLDRFHLVLAVVRDPTSRFRSEFAMRHHQRSEASEDLVDEWIRTQQARYAENPYVLDNHLRPQVEFLSPQAQVYRLEDSLEAMVTDLNSRFDLGLREGPVPHALKSEKRGLPSSAVPLSDFAKQHLADFYARDYAELGYEPPR